MALLKWSASGGSPPWLWGVSNRNGWQSSWRCRPAILGTRAFSHHLLASRRLVIALIIAIASNQARPGQCLAHFWVFGQGLSIDAHDVEDLAQESAWNQKTMFGYGFLHDCRQVCGFQSVVACTALSFEGMRDVGVRVLTTRTSPLRSYPRKFQGRGPMV